MSLSPFHLALPVDDLDAAREFYAGVLGCTEGRSSNEWIDFNFFGHQVVAHLVNQRTHAATEARVDGTCVPIPHFGLMMTSAAFEDLAQRLRNAGVEFLVEPSVRYRGKIAEQATMFLMDPSGNALEFKAYAYPDQTFTQERIAVT